MQEKLEPKPLMQLNNTYQALSTLDNVKFLMNNFLDPEIPEPHLMFLNTTYNPDSFIEHRNMVEMLLEERDLSDLIQRLADSTPKESRSAVVRMINYAMPFKNLPTRVQAAFEEKRNEEALLLDDSNYETYHADKVSNESNSLATEESEEATSASDSQDNDTSVDEISDRYIKYYEKLGITVIRNSLFKPNREAAVEQEMGTEPSEEPIDEKSDSDIYCIWY